MLDDRRARLRDLHLLVRGSHPQVRRAGQVRAAHAAPCGKCGTARSGSWLQARCEPGAPGCLPGFRLPRCGVRAGGVRPGWSSSDGGSEELPEFRDAARSSLASRSSSSESRPASAAFSAVSSAFSARSAATTSAAPGVSGTPVLHQSRPSVSSTTPKAARHNARRGLNLKCGPGFSVHGMRVDQVTERLTVGQLAARTGVRTTRSGTTNAQACCPRAADRRGPSPVRVGRPGPAAVHPRRPAARAAAGRDPRAARRPRHRHLRLRARRNPAAAPRRRDRRRDRPAGHTAGRAARHAHRHARPGLPRPAARNLVPSRPLPTRKEVTAMCPCCGTSTCDGSFCDDACECC